MTRLNRPQARHSARVKPQHNAAPVPHARDQVAANRSRTTYSKRSRRTRTRARHPHDTHKTHASQGWKPDHRASTSPAPASSPRCVQDSISRCNSRPQCARASSLLPSSAMPAIGILNDLFDFKSSPVYRGGVISQHRADDGGVGVSWRPLRHPRKPRGCHLPYLRQGRTYSGVHKGCRGIARDLV
jgi:hypothetical protein